MFDIYKKHFIEEYNDEEKKEQPQDADKAAQEKKLSL